MGIARRAVSEAGIIVAVGGDGTINEVINGMAGAQCCPAAPDERGCILGIVPAGTVNVLALELGIPHGVERACDVIAAGKTRLIDLGRANDRRFALMAGAGIDALTVRNVDPRTKKFLRELAFVGTGLRQGLADRPPPFLVRAEGAEHRTTFFVAGNSHYYASHLSLTPSADPTDGSLDLILFTGTTRSSLAAFWLETPSGLHLRNPHVVSFRAREVELAPLDDAETIWFQTDGELAGSLPALVTVEPQALEVLAP